MYSMCIQNSIIKWSVFIAIIVLFLIKVPCFFFYNYHVVKMQEACFWHPANWWSTLQFCRKHVSCMCGKYSYTLETFNIFCRKYGSYISLKWQNFCRNYISYTCRKHASCIFKVQEKSEVKVTWNLLKCTSTGYFFVWRMLEALTLSFYM